MRRVTAFGLVGAISAAACGGECDADGDGHEAKSCGGRDCDDSDFSVHPGGKDDPFPWISETIDEEGTVGLLAFDEAGSPQVVYATGSSAPSVRHAFLQEGAWQIEEVFREADVIGVSVASDGTLYAGLRDPGDTIHLATRSAGAWSVEEVLDLDRGSDASLVVPGSEPLFAVVHSDDFYSFVGIAARFEEGWAVERIAEYPSWGGLDSRVHGIVGEDAALQIAACLWGSMLLYAEQPDGWFVHELPDASCRTEFGISSAAAEGALHLAFVDRSYGIAHTTDAQGWSLEPVTPHTHSPSLAIGPDGPLVAFTDEREWTTGNIRIASRATGVFQSFRVSRDAFGGAGRGAALAIAPDGTARIVTGSPLRLLSPAPPLDADCDGSVRMPQDADADGWLDAGVVAPDCDDADASVFPGAHEVIGDLVDSDCNGSDR